MTDAAQPPGRAGIAAYAMGSFGTGVFSTVPSVLLLYFCTEVLHIPPAWAAMAVFAPKAWGIFWDPLVGTWSDRTHSRLGRRRPFLIAGTIGVAVSFWAVFSPPALAPAAAFVWIAATYFALATLYSLFAVPYIALPAQLGVTAALRGRLVSWRMTVAMVGVLAGAGVAPLLVAAAGGGRTGYAVMALWVAAACAVAMTAPILMLRGRDISTPRDAAAGGPGFLRQVGDALKHREFRKLACAYVLQLSAVGIVSASAPYLVTQAFARSEGDIGIALLAMLTATTVMVPAWAWLGRRIGERTALIAAVAAFGAATCLLGGMARADAAWPLALAGFAAVGIPFAGMQVLPFTLVAHLVHEEGRRGTPAEGAFTGIWTAAEKFGLALGPALTGLALTAAHGDIPHGLTVFVMGGPLLLALLSLPLLRDRRGAPAVPAAGSLS